MPTFFQTDNDSQIKAVDMDSLIEIVKNGGSVRTGVDIYNKIGVLLLEKDVRVDSVNPLEFIKKNGFDRLPIDSGSIGGVWDGTGRLIADSPIPMPGSAPFGTAFMDSGTPDALQQRLLDIQILKREAAQKYAMAKSVIKQIISDIKKTGGDFDYDLVEATVTDLLSFLTKSEDAFAYLAHEIFSYDDYLYNHSINVCTIGSAVIGKFNKQNYVLVIDRYTPDQLKDIAIGYFLHDVGKILISEEILNKTGPLSRSEFDRIKIHSFEKGVQILRQNRIENTFVENVVKYHHSPLYPAEPNCYPEEPLPTNLPLYVKICKLADIYDAMTSRRCYKAALNPVAVVTKLYNDYAGKEDSLQFVLHSFINAIGIYPAGCSLSLSNGQMAYVVDSNGPILLIYTDREGRTIEGNLHPVDLSNLNSTNQDLRIDMRKPLVDPVTAYKRFPAYLKTYFAY